MSSILCCTTNIQHSRACILVDPRGMCSSSSSNTLVCSRWKLSCVCEGVARDLSSPETTACVLGLNVNIL